MNRNTAVLYYRTRITDADGKRVAIYGLTREELYDRMEDAQKKIAEVVFHMSDMVPEALNAALDSLFTPKEPGEQEYQGVDGLLYCRNCHTPVQCRVKLWGRDKIVPCLCRCQQEAMAEKKHQNELVGRQRRLGS